MYTQQQSLEQAAIHLLQKLAVPNGAISMSSFRDETGNTSIKVFLLPEFKYLQSKIPANWEGFSVICETSSMPTLQ